MIEISKDGTITLRGKVAQPLLVAIRAIRDEVNDGEIRGDIDDWECALGDFIGEDVANGEVRDRCNNGASYTWRDTTVQYPER